MRNEILHCIILLYGSPIWYIDLNIKSHRTEITKTDREGLLSATSAYRTTFTKSWYVVRGDMNHSHISPIGDIVWYERDKWRGVKYSKKPTYGEVSEWMVWETELAYIRVWEEWGHIQLNYISTHRHWWLFYEVSERNQCVLPEVNNAKHKLFKCHRWHTGYIKLEKILGEIVNADNLTKHTCKSK